MNFSVSQIPQVFHYKDGKLANTSILSTHPKELTQIIEKMHTNLTYCHQNLESN